jgi:hypothetical protein
VQASVRSRFMAKLFQFIPEVQNTALEINDHQVISRAMEQSFGNLIFEGFPPAAIWSGFGTDLRLFRSDNYLPTFDRIINRNLHDRMCFLDFQSGFFGSFNGRERVFSLPVHFQSELMKRWFALSSDNVWRTL